MFENEHLRSVPNIQNLDGKRGTSPFPTFRYKGEKMKKFERFRMSEKNPKWENAIFRRKRLYSPKFGTDTMRSEFDRDYTRIINCNAYKRLKGKTQVFFAPDNDHVCTRLEHVNLVESISYTIANGLGLNSELTKAISVGHDLGHTPFGHQGEKILNDIARKRRLRKILAWKKWFRFC